ncbi:histidine phosphatase family protein [Nocardia nova]|uniref:histidine phosphatase family protein n=1 Tax=Nocardia nova TaxID=37330 RepID=UPI0033C46F74
MNEFSAQPTVDCVYLARHGRTAYNAGGLLRGLSDPPLDEVGAEEADKLAAALAERHLTAVLSSPLQRAVSTARAIADAAGLEVRIDARLNDRDYGPWTGHPRADVEERFGSVDNAPGVEPADALATRALSAFLAIASEFRGGPIALVSHDAFNRAVLHQLDPTLTDIPQPTACWNRLDLDHGRWTVTTIGHKP